MSVYPSSYARMPILSQQNTCNSFFMRILSLYRRVFFFFSSQCSALTIILCWFVFFLLSVFVSFTFYALDFFRHFARNVYFFFSRCFFYETAFISRFRYRFPRNISHFPNYSVYIYIHTIICTYITIRNRVIENEDV